MKHQKHVYIIMNKDISWHRHICSIKFNYKLDRISLERVYISNIRLIVEYGDVIWACGNNCDLDQLEMVQEEAARMVTGATADVTLQH